MRILSIILLSGAGLAFLGEIAARIIGFGNPPLVKLDDKIEYYLVPGEYHRFGKLYRVNSRSMRGDEIASASYPPSSTYAVLGDSVVYGQGIDQNAIVARQLQQIFSSSDPSSAPDPQVLSIAASSWGPENLLGFYERFGPFPGNTAWVVQSTHDMTDVMHQPNEGVPYRTTAPFGALHDAVMAVAPRLIPRPALPERESHETKRERADAALANLIARLKSDYAHVVLVFHATKDEALQNAPSGEQHFRDLAQSSDIDFVSTLLPYREAYRSGAAPHRDQIHLSESGALLLSRLLQSSLDPHRPSTAQ